MTADEARQEAELVAIATLPTVEQQIKARLGVPAAKYMGGVFRVGVCRQDFAVLKDLVALRGVRPERDGTILIHTPSGPVHAFDDDTVPRGGMSLVFYSRTAKFEGAE